MKAAPDRARFEAEMADLGEYFEGFLACTEGGETHPYLLEDKDQVDKAASLAREIISGRERIALLKASIPRGKNPRWLDAFGRKLRDLDKRMQKSAFLFTCVNDLRREMAADRKNPGWWLTSHLECDVGAIISRHSDPQGRRPKKKLQEHLATCEPCQDLDARLGASAGLLRTMDADWQVHPGHEVLVAFQEGDLSGSDAEAVQEHLKECGECREKVELLREADRKVEGPAEDIGGKRFAGWRKLKEALVRLVEFPLASRMPAMAAAAAWDLRDAPDDERRLDRPGETPFEAYLQRFGDRLIVSVFYEESKRVEFIGVRDAFTGELIGSIVESRDNNEFVCELGSAHDLKGRRIAVILVAEGRPVRLEVDIVGKRAG